MRDLSSCRTMPLTSLEVKGLGVATAADLPVAAGLPASSAPAAEVDGDPAEAAFWSSAWPFLAFAGGLGFRGRRHAAVSWPPAPQLKQRPSVGSNRAPSDLQWRIGHGQPALQPVARLLKCGQMATPLPPASSLPFPSLPFGSPFRRLGSNNLAGLNPCAPMLSPKWDEWVQQGSQNGAQRVEHSIKQNQSNSGCLF